MLPSVKTSLDTENEAGATPWHAGTRQSFPYCHSGLDKVSSRVESIAWVMKEIFALAHCLHSQLIFYRKEAESSVQLWSFSISAFLSPDLQVSYGRDLVKWSYLMWGTVLASPRSCKLSNKRPSARCRILLLELSDKGVPTIPQSIQSIAIALDCSIELDGIYSSVAEETTF